MLLRIIKENGDVKGKRQRNRDALPTQLSENTDPLSQKEGPVTC